MSSSPKKKRVTSISKLRAMLKSPQNENEDFESQKFISAGGNSTLNSDEFLKRKENSPRSSVKVSSPDPVIIPKDPFEKIPANIPDMPEDNRRKEMQTFQIQLNAALTSCGLYYLLNSNSEYNPRGLPRTIEECLTVGDKILHNPHRMRVKALLDNAVAKNHASILSTTSTLEDLWNWISNKCVSSAEVNLDFYLLQELMAIKLVRTSHTETNAEALNSLQARMLKIREALGRNDDGFIIPDKLMVTHLISAIKDNYHFNNAVQNLLTSNVTFDVAFDQLKNLVALQNTIEIPVQVTSEQSKTFLAINSHGQKFRQPTPGSQKRNFGSQQKRAFN